MQSVEVNYGEPPKVKRSYFHKGECFTSYLADTEFKRQEKEQKDILVFTIAEIYGVDYKIIPPTFYLNVEQLRNGNPHLRAKNYKNGYTYEFLTDVYLYCKDDIRKVKTYKNDFETFEHELRYGLAMVRNSMYDVTRHKEKQKAHEVNQEIIKEAYELNIAHYEKEVEYKPRNQKRSNDISEFLD